MSEHHDHRDDCPFKFATLDVCDCVEKNMLDRIEALETKLATCETKLATCEKYRDAYAEMGRIGTQAVRDLEAKLAKAVEALRFYAWENEMRLPSDGPWGAGSTDFGKVARAALAEIKGESHE